MNDASAQPVGFMVKSRRWQPGNNLRLRAWLWEDRPVGAAGARRAGHKRDGERMKRESTEISKARAALARAQRASERAADARAALPMGSSRARVTTANARWRAAAEARDRAEAHLNSLLEMAPC